MLDKSRYAQHLRWKDFTLFDRLAYFPSLMTWLLWWRRWLCISIINKQKSKSRACVYEKAEWGGDVVGTWGTLIFPHLLADSMWLHRILWIFIVMKFAWSLSWMAVSMELMISWHMMLNEPIFFRGFGLNCRAVLEFWCVGAWRIEFWRICGRYVLD